MTASAYSRPHEPYKYLTPISYKSFTYLMKKRPHLKLKTTNNCVACHHFIVLQQMEILFGLGARIPK